MRVNIAISLLLGPMLNAEYIFQEILEQEKIISTHRSLPEPCWPSATGKIIVTGSGDSHCAALFGGWLLEERGRVAGLPALEASRIAQRLSQGDVLIGISVSGHTVRVLEAANRALAAGAEVVAVTDNVQSPLAQLGSVVWPIHASPAEELHQTNYQNEDARQYIGYHHDVAQTKTFWAVLLTFIRAALLKFDWRLLLDHTRYLLAPTFYEPIFARASLWAESGQVFFLGSDWARIAARFAAYKMYEFNRMAHYTGTEEYCHTHYFITRKGDTIVFLVFDQDTSARSAEIVPVLHELFGARIIWLQPGSLAIPILPTDCSNSVEFVNLPATDEPVQQFLDFIIALQWITYSIGRIGAPDINTFHAGHDTERLVAGTLRTIRRSAIRLSGSGEESGIKSRKQE